MYISLTGLAITLVFFIALILTFISGYRLGNKSKVKVPTIDEKEALKARQRKEGWDNIMNYDINVALNANKFKT